VQGPAEFLERWQYAGLFAVILAEEAGVPLPVPGDLFIAAMGFLAQGAPSAFVRTAVVVTLATVLGASVLYTLARRAGRPLLLRVARRFGYSEAREARLEAWLARRGAGAVVVGRLIPGLRIVMTVVAGALRLGRPTFVLGTCVAGLVWASLYFWIGYGLGAGYSRIAGGIPLREVWPWALAAVVVAAFVVWSTVRRRRVAEVASPRAN
jgi:membrane protein DedA with SNARE-associated domain